MSLAIGDHVKVVKVFDEQGELEIEDEQGQLGKTGKVVSIGSLLEQWPYGVTFDGDPETEIWNFYEKELEVI